MIRCHPTSLNCPSMGAEWCASKSDLMRLTCILEILMRGWDDLFGMQMQRHHFVCCIPWDIFLCNPLEKVGIGYPGVATHQTNNHRGARPKISQRHVHLIVRTYKLDDVWNYLDRVSNNLDYVSNKSTTFNYWRGVEEFRRERSHREKSGREVEG